MAGLTAILATAIAVTAVITYTLTRENDGTPTQLTSPQAEERRSSTAEQAAAKERLCQVFNVSVRGKEGQGGVRVNGELNVPLVLRKVNSAVAVENTLTSATPPEVGSAARKYIETSLDLTTAALGNVHNDELIRLTNIGNSATYALADVCGLPH